MNESLPLTAVAAVAAGAVAAVSGFGIGSLLTPLLVAWMPAPHAVAIVAVPHVVATGLRWVRLRRHVHRATFVQFGLASAAGGLLGALLQSRLAAPALTGVLATLLAMAGISELIGWRVPLPRTRAGGVLGGLLSGAFGGMVGNQGGIRAAALLGLRLEPRSLVATATASALLVDAARLPVYIAFQGDAMRAHLPLIGVAVAGVVAGTLIGVPVLGKIPERWYRRLIGGLLVALAIGLALTAWGDARSTGEPIGARRVATRTRVNIVRRPPTCARSALGRGGR